MLAKSSLQETSAKACMSWLELRCLQGSSRSARFHACRFVFCTVKTASRDKLLLHLSIMKVDMCCHFANVSEMAGKARF